MEIVNECAVGLAETQKRSSLLSKGVEFETEEDFRNKVNDQESYFTRRQTCRVCKRTHRRSIGTPCQKHSKRINVRVR